MYLLGVEEVKDIHPLESSTSSGKVVRKFTVTVKGKNILLQGFTGLTGTPGWLRI